MTTDLPAPGTRVRATVEGTVTGGGVQVGKWVFIGFERLTDVTPLPPDEPEVDDRRSLRQRHEDANRPIIRPGKCPWDGLDHEYEQHTHLVDGRECCVKCGMQISPGSGVVRIRRGDTVTGGDS